MCMSNWIQKNLHKELEETEKVWERESDLPQGKKYNNCLVSMVSLEKIQTSIYLRIYIFIFIYLGIYFYICNNINEKEAMILKEEI